MELKYIEIDGKHVELPSPQEMQRDQNEDAVARMAETMEQIETAGAPCIALGTSASFIAE